MERDSPETSTASEDLLRRFQAGDTHALDRLWARYLPRLKRWAHGRLPAPSRIDTDTDDLVQDAFVRSLARLRALKPRGPRSLFAYFKKIVLNQIRDQVRRRTRRPTRETLDSQGVLDDRPSPLEEILGGEVLQRYQRALPSLSREDEDLVLAVVELRCDDQEIAELFDKPSIAAARMARGRALARLARAMEASTRG